MIKGTCQIGIDFKSRKQKVSRFMMLPNYQYEINVEQRDKNIRLDFLFSNSEITDQKYNITFTIPIENNISINELVRRLEIITARDQFVVVINSNNFPEKNNIQFIGQKVNKPIDFIEFHSEWPVSYFIGRMSKIPLFNYDYFNNIADLMSLVKKTKFKIDKAK